MINHAIVIKLAKVLDFRNSSLVELEVILLQAYHDVFQDVINDGCDELLVVSVQSAS